MKCSRNDAHGLMVSGVDQLHIGLVVVMLKHADHAYQLKLACRFQHDLPTCDHHTKLPTSRDCSLYRTQLPGWY